MLLLSLFLNSDKWPWRRT